MHCVVCVLVRKGLKEAVIVCGYVLQYIRERERESVCVCVYVCMCVRGGVCACKSHFLSQNARKSTLLERSKKNSRSKIRGSEFLSPQKDPNNTTKLGVKFGAIYPKSPFL